VKLAATSHADIGISCPVARELFGICMHSIVVGRFEMMVE
jgi:hypothetical protein